MKMSGIKKSKGDYKPKRGNREAPQIRMTSEDTSSVNDDFGMGNEAEWVPAAASFNVDQVTSNQFCIEISASN